MEFITDDRDVTLGHQFANQRNGIVMENCRRHADGHAFGPIKRRHLHGAGAEAKVFAFVLRGQVRPAIHQQLDDFVRAFIRRAMKCGDAVIIGGLDVGALVQ